MRVFRSRIKMTPGCLDPMIAIGLLLPLLLNHPAADEGERSWHLIDGVAVQAGDDILTMSEFQRFFEKKLRERAISTQEEFERELREAASASVTLSLETQAGRDMGIDPERVDRVVHSKLAERRRAEGVEGFVDYLEEQGLDPISAEKDQRRQLYRSLWRDRQIGRTGAGDRAIRDPFVRPGILRVRYLLQGDELSEPAKVRLQVLDLPVKAVGGVGLARKLAGEIRQRALDGEDFGDLVLEYGASYRETLGVSELLAIPQIVDEPLRAFAEKAEVGDISAVLPIAPKGETIGFRITRLHEKEEGEPAPPFSTPWVQRALRAQIRRSWQEGQLARARRLLEEASFVWRSPQLEAPTPGPIGSPTPGGAPPPAGAPHPR